MALLLGSDFKRLTLALTDAFPTDGDLSDLTRIYLDEKLRVITAPESIPLMVERIIDWVEARDKTAALIRGAMELRPTVATLQTYGKQLLDRAEAARVRPDWYAGPADPYETCFVPGQSPFISRKALRDFVRGLTKAEGGSVMVVNGVSKAGKTYSFQLFAYVWRAVSETPGAFALARVDLQDEVPSTYQPERFIDDLMIQLRWPKDAMPKRPTTRYGKELAKWLVGESKHNKAVTVIVLDGFFMADLSTETLDLVQQLILLVSANDSKIRLVLLNFPLELIPPDPPGPVQYENVTALTASEVTDFFSALYQQKGRPPDHAVIDEVVQTVIKSVTIPETAPGYNRALNEIVKRVAATLK